MDTPPRPLDNGRSRFWVETIFLFIVLVFSMAQLVRDAPEKPVYFTLISGICGKIAKLKIKGSSPLLSFDETDSGRRGRNVV